MTICSPTFTLVCTHVRKLLVGYSQIVVELTYCDENFLMTVYAYKY